MHWQGYKRGSSGRVLQLNDCRAGNKARSCRIGNGTARDTLGSVHRPCSNLVCGWAGAFLLVKFTGGTLQSVMTGEGFEQDIRCSCHCVITGVRKVSAALTPWLNWASETMLLVNCVANPEILGPEPGKAWIQHSDYFFCPPPSSHLLLLSFSFSFSFF